jgi:hypothetical protein
MKLIITENKLNNLILNYIEDMFPVNEINYTEFEDENGNPDDSAYSFYIGDYDDGEETIFRWYGKEYWRGDDTEILRHRIERSPVLFFEDSNNIDKLNAMFGDKWEPVFKQWFDEHFGLEINKVM